MATEAPKRDKTPAPEAPELLGTTEDIKRAV